MTQDPSCVQKESWRLRRALSVAQNPGSLPPGGRSAPGQPRAHGPERALSTPFSSVAAAAGYAPSTPLSSCVRGVSSLPTCPQLCGTGSSAQPVS